MADYYNGTAGDLDKYDGIDCSICHNKGFVARVIDRNGFPETVMADCECKIARSNNRALKESGLSEMAKRCTFDNFNIPESWQRGMLDKAVKFAVNHPEGWLYLGGQPGCGKTHLGVAAAVSIMKERKTDARYYVWTDAVRNTWGDFDAYKRFAQDAKECGLLFIDDLFKPARDKIGNKLPTPNEIETAFEILNFRYNRENATTIISCEYTISELCGIDEALGSRIVEATRKTDSCISVSKKPGRNYRLNGITEL